jgi:hypothetical protein
MMGSGVKRAAVEGDFPKGGMAVAGPHAPSDFVEAFDSLRGHVRLVCGVGESPMLEQKLCFIGLNERFWGFDEDQLVGLIESAAEQVDAAQAAGKAVEPLASILLALRHGLDALRADRVLQ